ncbi:MAG: hypothetical protein HFJ34_08020 [Clostridia bacterium]|nr:hypothetical protein [Clostridia bacterium]
MGQKKNSKIILIVIILLVMLILLTGIAYTFFATDLLKSNKDLFFKYITQIADEKEGFFENQLSQYFKRQKNTPYNNEGTFALNVTSENGEPKEYEKVNQFNISFSGVTDQENQSLEQNISLNYSDEVAFPFSYRQIKDAIGLQTKYVGNKYVTIETDKLQNQNIDEIDGANNLVKAKEKIAKLTQFPFNKEEWKQVQETYIKVISDQLQDSQFTKIEENNKKGYKLTIQAEQIKNIEIQILETLKNDQMTLDKINQYMEEQNISTKITTNTIDNQIKDIQRNTSSEEENYEITVFEEKGKTTKILLTTQEVELNIEKKKEDNSLQYTISMETIGEDDNNRISFQANYIGLKDLQNVAENYEIEIEAQMPNYLIAIDTSNSNQASDKMIYKYQFNNQINFTDTVNIEEFSDDNAMILNNYENEQVSNFLQQVVERIQFVNQQQMEELGVAEDENPLTKMLDPIVGGMFSYPTRNNGKY